MKIRGKLETGNPTGYSVSGIVLAVDDGIMEEVNCYNCGSDRNTFYASENGFTLVKCVSCGLLYVTPRPSLEEIAQANKYGVHQGDEKIEVTGYFSNLEVNEYLRILDDFFVPRSISTKKTWLDIGCGHGEFIQALQHFSNNNTIIIKGLEPNINKQKSARKRGLDVSYFELDKHTTHYDFISLLNVYSHLSDPKAALADWKHLLKPGGELFLETGDTAHLDSKDHYRPFLLPGHLSFASEDIVVEILEKIGFEIMDVKKYPSFKWNSIVIGKEILKIFWPNKRSRIKYFIKRKIYNTDMYIRAKLKS